MCRSRRELSNAYLLAKIGVDTAENEPLEVWGENSIQYSLHSLDVSRSFRRSASLITDQLLLKRSLLARQRAATKVTGSAAMGPAFRFFRPEIVGSARDLDCDVANGAGQRQRAHLQTCSFD